MEMKGGAKALTVAVAVKNAEGKGSQRAVRWAVENLLPKADRLLLVHVMLTTVPTTSGNSIPIRELDASMAEMYINDMKSKCADVLQTFRLLYRTQKIETLILEGDDTAVTLLRFISDSGTSSLVLGSCSSTRNMRDSEVPYIILKHAPDTCDIYVICANKLVSNSPNPKLFTGRHLGSRSVSKKEYSLSSSSTRSKFSSCISDINTLSEEHTQEFSDINSLSQEHTQEFSSRSSGSILDGADLLSQVRISEAKKTEGCTSIPSVSLPQIKMEQLRLELKKNIAMYNRACEDLVHARNKVEKLSAACTEDAQKVQAAKQKEENFRIMAAREKEKYLKAEKEVEISKKMLAKEAYERQMAELKGYEESQEKLKIVDALLTNDPRYRRYTSDEIKTATNSFSDDKIIGEGGFGKVYKCSLDHTPVAIKALPMGTSNKKDEFLREVEVLSQLRHPHIVLLLGACPEICSLVYEYMAGGSLDDHIFRKGGRSPLTVSSRFRIAFEVACGLAFLHSYKPEPIVHRDLKPGNILLDKFNVSKIGDVGLAKIIYDAVPENITEYGTSVKAGTVHYIDPEYLRTGTLRTKSDLYSFGVMTLQLLCGRHPGGIILKFENAINNGTISDLLDKSVAYWPLAEAHKLAEVALKCCRLKCRDRPDLESEVLPTLKRLAELVDLSTSAKRDFIHPPKHYYCPILQEIMNDPYIATDGFTYEHAAIKAWIDRHDISPVTKQKLRNKMLTPNHVMFSAIQEWRRQAAQAKV